MRAPLKDAYSMFLPERIYCHTGIYIGNNSFISKYTNKFGGLIKQEKSDSLKSGCYWTQAVLLKRGHMMAAERAIQALAEYKASVVNNDTTYRHRVYKFWTANCHHFTEECYKATEEDFLFYAQNLDNFATIRTMTVFFEDLQSGLIEEPEYAPVPTVETTVEEEVQQLIRLETTNLQMNQVVAGQQPLEIVVQATNTMMAEEEEDPQSSFMVEFSNKTASSIRSTQAG